MRPWPRPFPSLAILSLISSTQRGEELAHEERKKLRPILQYVRGIFAGGTFCYQAQLLFHAQRIRFRSNAPLSPEYALPNPFESEGHTLLDMGDEFFTQGRLHPMIDPALRKERIRKEAEDPEVAVLLLDFVLGYNASPDPAGDLIPALLEAQARKEKEGTHLAVVASVCGTEEDPPKLPGAGAKTPGSRDPGFPHPSPGRSVRALPDRRWKMNSPSPIQRLLHEGPRAINLGLKEFARALKAQGGEVVHVDWSPPPPETEDLQNLLEKLL